MVISHSYVSLPEGIEWGFKIWENSVWVNCEGVWHGLIETKSPMIEQNLPEDHMGIS
jgi:hypothetical protein